MTSRGEGHNNSRPHKGRTVTLVQHYIEIEISLHIKTLVS